jgi:hypothetical protein
MSCRIGAIDVRTWLRLAAVPLVLWSAPTALAQDPPALPSPPETTLSPPLTLSYVDGRVDVARADGVQPAQAPDVLDDGDRLLVADGRAELVYDDGAIVHVDRDADLWIDADARLRIVRGRIVVRTSTSTAIDVTTPVGIVRLEPRGEYLITARDLDGESTIAAIAGRATLALAAADVPIAAADELAIDPRGLEPRWSRLGARRDAFTDWAERRVDDMRYASRGQPLPVELTAYAPGFATYGRWDTLPSYGPVWFPTAGPGWRPYANGGWRHTRHGWTWIDSDPWGWPVHHYGRWGRHASRGWYWIPRRTWGPAWVGWAVETDYIGWSPLGWNSRPVVDFFVGARLGPVDLWAGSWSVVPRRVFGGRGPIGRYYTDVRYLPRPVLGGFVVQSHSPRGPAGWDRRAMSNRTYDQPMRYLRDRRGFDRTPSTRVPSGPGAVPRVGPRPRVGGDVAPGVGERPPAGASRDPRAWRGPGAEDGRTREVAPRSGDARRPGDAPDGRRMREVAPRADTDVGRPAPDPGRASGRSEPDAARPRGETRGQDRDAGRGDRPRGDSPRAARERGAARQPSSGGGSAGAARERGPSRQPSSGGRPSEGGGNRRRPR